MKQLWSNLSYYVNLFKEEFKQKKKSSVRTVDGPADI